MTETHDGTSCRILFESFDWPLQSENVKFIRRPLILGRISADHAWCPINWCTTNRGTFICQCYEGCSQGFETELTCPMSYIRTFAEQYRLPPTLLVGLEIHSLHHNKVMPVDLCIGHPLLLPLLLFLLPLALLELGPLHTVLHLETGRVTVPGEPYPNRRTCSYIQSGCG